MSINAEESFAVGEIAGACLGPIASDSPDNLYVVQVSGSRAVEPNDTMTATMVFSIDAAASFIVNFVHLAGRNDDARRLVASMHEVAERFGIPWEGVP